MALGAIAEGLRLYGRWPHACLHRVAGCRCCGFQWSSCRQQSGRRSECLPYGLRPR
jgi:hypothetical protein